MNTQHIQSIIRGAPRPVLNSAAHRMCAELPNHWLHPELAVRLLARFIVEDYERQGRATPFVGGRSG